MGGESAKEGREWVGGRVGCGWRRCRHFLCRCGAQGPASLCNPIAIVGVAITVGAIVGGCVCSARKRFLTAPSQGRRGAMASTKASSIARVSRSAAQSTHQNPSGNRR